MLTIDEIKDKLIKLLIEVTDNTNLKDTLTFDSDIIAEVGLDSIQMINFILLTEDEFNVEIDFSNFSIEELNSLKLFSEFVSDLISKKL